MELKFVYVFTIFSSVPIGGLFNLTLYKLYLPLVMYLQQVSSVPIGGLFNLTENEKKIKNATNSEKVPSPLGDYLI